MQFSQSQLNFWQPYLYQREVYLIHENVLKFSQYCWWFNAIWRSFFWDCLHTVPSGQFTGIKRWLWQWHDRRGITRWADDSSDCWPRNFCDCSGMDMCLARPKSHTTRISLARTQREVGKFASDKRVCQVWQFSCSNTICSAVVPLPLMPTLTRSKPFRPWLHKGDLEHLHIVCPG